MRRVFVCGIATDFCVAWSAVDAVDHGFETVLLRNLSVEIDLDGSLQAQLTRCPPPVFEWSGTSGLAFLCGDADTAMASAVKYSTILL